MPEQNKENFWKYMKIISNLVLAVVAVLVVVFFVPKVLRFFMPFVIGFIISLIITGEYKRYTARWGESE